MIVVRLIAINQSLVGKNRSAAIELTASKLVDQVSDHPTNQQLTAINRQNLIVD
jgi:hypothetical protein